MKIITDAVRSIANASFADGHLAIATLLLVIFVASILHFLPALPLVGGLILLFGCPLILGATVFKAKRR